MFLQKPKAEKSPKKYSRKQGQHRNNSILSTSPQCHYILSKDPVSNQSRSSLHMSQADDVESLLKKIQDLKQEKDSLLNLVKSNEKELDFCNQIISQFVDLNELLKIKQNSQFDETAGTWVIPSFIVQHKKTVFPKLQKNQLKEMLQNEMKQRKIIIKQDDDSVKGNEENLKDVGCFYEGEGRPVTSLAKYRQSSLYGRGDTYEESRRSPMLRKAKMKF